MHFKYFILSLEQILFCLNHLVIFQAFNNLIWISVTCRDTLQLIFFLLSAIIIIIFLFRVVFVNIIGVAII